MRILKVMAVSILACIMLVVVVGIVAAAPAGLSRIASVPMNDDPEPTITPTIEPEPTITPTIEPVPTITPTIEPVLTTTLPHTQPVAAAIALYFDIPYTQVIALHDSGIGFGVIARAFLTAKASNGALTPEQLLALHQAGTGWGQIKKQFGVHPGGNGLGTIMSGKASGNPSGSGGTSNTVPSMPSSGLPGVSPGTGRAFCPGNSCNAPGQNKAGRGPKK